jgi:hypothetical protein
MCNVWKIAVCPFVILLLAIVLSVLLSSYCWPLCCLSFCHLTVGHCVVCPSINSFWLFHWYLQTLLMTPDIKLTESSEHNVTVLQSAGLRTSLQLKHRIPVDTVIHNVIVLNLLIE